MPEPDAIAGAAPRGEYEELGAFAGSVAHAVNNLFGVIGNYVSLLGLGGDDQQAQADLAAIRSGIDRGARLTGELARFAESTVAGSPSPVDVGGTVAEFAPSLRALLGETVSLTVQLDDRPATAWADARRLGELLHRLVTNSIEAMPGGGQLAIAVHRLGDRVLLELADTGAGMTPEVRRRAVEPMFTTKPGHYGLGLASAQAIAAGWDATLELAAPLEGGTRVRLSLIAAPEPRSGPRPDGARGADRRPAGPADNCPRAGGFR